MKKVLAFALAACTLLSLAACGHTVERPVGSSAVSADGVPSLHAPESTAAPVTASATESTTAAATTATTAETTAATTAKPRTAATTKPAATTKRTSAPLPTAAKTTAAATATLPPEELPIPSGSEPEDTEYDVQTVPEFLADWTFAGDTVYTIHRRPNLLCVMDANDIENMTVFDLPGRPAELQIHGDRLMISYPDLQCIRVYDRRTLSQVEEYRLSFAVSSFCLDGDTVYATEYDQWCRAFKVSLTTGEAEQIGGFFFQPAIRIDKARGRLYIGESDLSTARLFCYDLSDLTQYQTLEKDGCIPRTLFLVGGYVYWNTFKLLPGISGAAYQYDGAMLHVDEDFVITEQAIYDRITDQLIATLEDPISRVLITQSGNIVAYCASVNAVFSFRGQEN